MEDRKVEQYDTEEEIMKIDGEMYKVPGDVKDFVELGDIVVSPECSRSEGMYVVIADSLGEKVMIPVDPGEYGWGTVPARATSMFPDPLDFYDDIISDISHPINWVELDQIKHHGQRMELTGYRETSDRIIVTSHPGDSNMIIIGDMYIVLLEDFPNSVYDSKLTDVERQRAAMNYDALQLFFRISEAYSPPSAGDEIVIGSFRGELKVINDKVISINPDDVPHFGSLTRLPVKSVLENGDIVIDLHNRDVTLGLRILMVGNADFTVCTDGEYIVLFGEDL